MRCGVHSCLHQSSRTPVISLPSLAYAAAAALLLGVASVGGVQPFRKTTFHIVTWSNACVSAYPSSDLARRNEDAAALRKATDLLVGVWNDEFSLEAMPYRVVTGADTPALSTLLPMGPGDFRECFVACAAAEEPRAGYFDTMLGTQRYGLYDAYTLLQICLSASATAEGSAAADNASAVADLMLADTTYFKAILNAPLGLNAGFTIGNQIHISNAIVPNERPISRPGIRTWAGVLLHEALHTLWLGHARAPGAGSGSDGENEYGMFGDIMGTWVDHGFGHTRFANGAHMFALGFATPVPVLVYVDPATLVATGLTFRLPVTSPAAPANTSAVIAAVDAAEGRLIVDAVLHGDEDGVVPFGLLGSILPGRVYIRIISSPTPPLHRLLPPVNLVAMIPVTSSAPTCVDLREWIAPSPDGTYVRGRPPPGLWNAASAVVFSARVCARLADLPSDSVNVAVCFPAGCDTRVYGGCSV
jgi:hypothetical protein